MTSKQRALAAFAHKIPDRVPVNYFYNTDIDARLKAHFSLGPKDDEGLRQALGVDFRSVSVPYVGPKLHPDGPGFAATAASSTIRPMLKPVLTFMLGAVAGWMNSQQQDAIQCLKLEDRILRNRLNQERIRLTKFQ